MPSIEEKRLAIEMADKIIQTRLSHQATQNMRDNIRSGEVEYWKEIYAECLKIITTND